MIKKIFFPVVLLLLGYGFWVSPDLKETAAGIALFLFGMLCLEEGFKTFTGGTLESILRRSTKNVWQSLSFGAISTSLMQSSTLVSLITISFVSAEMISLAAGIGIVMGANIGSTTGAWLIAGLGLKVDIASYAMPALIFGVIFLLQKSKVYKGVGSVLLGIGFLFLGIHFMKSGFEAFQSSFDLASFAVSGMAGVLLFTLIGTVITAIMQSSHATLLIIIAALATGQVTYENALALAIGANLGSAITTAIGGMAANLDGKRLALAHVIFNVITAIVAVVFISEFIFVVDALGNVLNISDQNYLLKLALFHTLFNVLGVILLLPFIKQLEALLVRLVQKSTHTNSDAPQYLYDNALQTPQTAVLAVRREIEHLFDNVCGLIAHGISIRRSVLDSDEALETAVKYTSRIMPLDIDDVYENKIKNLHSEIVGFIAQAHMQESTQQATEALYALRQASRDLVEAVKDMKHLHKNLSRYGLSQQLATREPYDAMRLHLAQLLRTLHRLVKSSDDDPEMLRQVIANLRVSIQTSGTQLIDNVDHLLHAHLIRPEVVTSMMNDETYMMDITHNLIDAVEVMLSEATSEQ